MVTLALYGKSLYFSTYPLQGKSIIVYIPFMSSHFSSVHIFTHQISYKNPSTTEIFLLKPSPCNTVLSNPPQISSTYKPLFCVQKKKKNTAQKMSSRYPWYTKATDITHRLSVLGLVGFTIFMTANVGYTVLSNGKANEKRLTQPPQEKEQ